MEKEFSKYQYCLKNGHNHDALGLRKMILDEFIEKKDKHAQVPQILDMGAEAALSQIANKTDAYNEMKKIFPSILPKNKLELLSGQTLCLKPYHSKKSHELSFNQQNRNYQAAIKGKRIHLIGPAQDFKEQIEMAPQDEREKTIYVILNPYFGANLEQMIRDMEHTNAKNYIFYCNGGNTVRYFRTMCKHEREISLRPLWICLKASHIDKYPANSRQFPVPIFFPFSVYAGHSLNLMQLVLFDLSFMKPEKIRVSGFDFYTSKQIYQTGYRPGFHQSLEEKKQEIYRSFTEGGHDPITNLRYFKFMLRCFKSIEISLTLSKICDMDEESYLDCIKENF